MHKKCAMNMIFIITGLYKTLLPIEHSNIFVEIGLLAQTQQNNYQLIEGQWNWFHSRLTSTINTQYKHNSGSPHRMNITNL